VLFFVQLTVAPVQQVFGVRVVMDSLQYTDHNEIYRIDVFYDH